MSTKKFIKTRVGNTGPCLLVLEPYLAESHNALIQGFFKHLPGRWTLLAMPGRNFRWRMRGSAACMAYFLKELHEPFDALICSSMLNLAELKGLVPNLAKVPSLVYFHENQLTYPTPGKADKRQQRRDLFLGFSNITTAMAANKVVFNSKFHKNEFMAAAHGFMKAMPDFNLDQKITDLDKNSLVLPVPLEKTPEKLSPKKQSGPLRIVWNHRWEHDKDPQSFFEALFDLAQEQKDFEVVVLGQRAAKWPEIFDQAQKKLGSRLRHMGYCEKKTDYFSWLNWADLVVSTAKQEYLGLSVAEGVLAGARPLVPNTLAYPELYDHKFRYEPGNLLKALSVFVNNPKSAREKDWSYMALDLTWEKQKINWQKTIDSLF